MPSLSPLLPLCLEADLLAWEHELFCTFLPNFLDTTLLKTSVCLSRLFFFPLPLSSYQLEIRGI